MRACHSHTPPHPAPSRLQQNPGSLPPAPPAPTTPLASCMSLHWLVLWLVGLLLPSLALYVMEDRSCEHVVRAALQQQPGSPHAWQARQEALQRWPHLVHASPHPRAGPSTCSRVLKWAGAAAPPAVAGLVLWQATSAVWLVLATATAHLQL